MKDHKIDDTLLGAFLDRELDEAETARVGQLIGEDSQLQDRLQSMENADLLLRNSFEQLMNETVPPHIEAAIGPAKDPAWSPLQALSRLLTPGFAGGFATAAAILVAVGLMSGDLLESGTGNATARGLQQALADTPSGVPATFPIEGGTAEILPVLSFRKAGGEICRQYEQTTTLPAGTTLASGIACSSGGSWRVVAFSEIANAGDEVTTGSDYVPAAGEESRVIDDLADGWIADAPFSRADEERLIRNGWRD